MMWIIPGIIISAAVFTAWLYLDEEKQLRRLYKMFGTTGFGDVDRRLNRRAKEA